MTRSKTVALSRRALLGAMASPLVARALPPSSGKVLSKTGTSLGIAAELKAAVTGGIKSADVEHALAAGWTELDRAMQLTSATDPQSDLGRVNGAAGSASVVVDE